MEQGQLKKLKVWFEQYVAGFYGDDDYVNANLKLKEDHTHRTCDQIRYLADHLSLSDNQKRIAETIALFHDIGRFEQFKKYRTYNDPRSTNHCLLGLDVLKETDVLNEIDKKERDLIEKAIRFHGQKQLPDDLDGQCLLFSRLIRDADKLDVYYIVTQYYKQYQKDPRNFAIELELPDQPRYSPQVVDAILQGRLIDYNSLKTLNDMKLLQLGWVYDVNFTAALRRIKQRQFLEKLLDFLPKTQDIENVKEKIFAYVDFRIRQEPQK